MGGDRRDHPREYEMKLNQYVTSADVILMALVVFLAGVLFVVLPGRVVSGGTEVEVIARGKSIGKYSLSQDRLIEVPGPLGTTLVEIEGGRVHIRSSPCPHKICTRMGELGKEGGALACIPNEVVVRVGKELTRELDAVSR
jgi:hypothetical protein